MTLMGFGKIVKDVSELKKPISDGKEIPGWIMWKEIIITRIIKESFNGLALTNFIFCCN